jgi:hypothetical protein
MPCYLSDNLCDYPVGNEKTCDRLIYEDRYNPIAPNVQFSDAHYSEWRKFVENGGVKELENVIAFGFEKQKAHKKPTPVSEKACCELVFIT